MLRDFLHDHGRCGAHGLTAPRYASAVVYCLENLGGDWPIIDVARNTQDFSAIQHQTRKLNRHSALPCFEYAEKFLQKAASTNVDVTASLIVGVNKQQENRKHTKKNLEHDIVQHLERHFPFGHLGERYTSLQLILEPILQKSGIWSRHLKEMDERRNAGGKHPKMEASMLKKIGLKILGGNRKDSC